MLGISEENILDRHDGEPAVPDEFPSDAVQLKYNAIDPMVLRDGIDRIAVSERPEGYQIHYWGYLAGRLLVTRAGVAELSEHLFADPAPVPRWLVVADTVTDSTRPWWLPDDYPLHPEVQCEHCSTTVHADSILLPGWTDRDDPPKNSAKTSITTWGEYTFVMRRNTSPPPDRSNGLHVQRKGTTSRHVPGVRPHE